MEKLPSPSNNPAMYAHIYKVGGLSLLKVSRDVWSESYPILRNIV